MTTTPEYDKLAHERGGYDLRKMAERSSAIPTPEGYTSDGAEPTALDGLQFRYIEACEERDHLRAELSKFRTKGMP